VRKSLNGKRRPYQYKATTANGQIHAIPPLLRRTQQQITAHRSMKPRPQRLLHRLQRLTLPVQSHAYLKEDSRLPHRTTTATRWNHQQKNPACNGYTTANGLITADPTSELLRLITCLREATRATPTITTHATTATTSPTTADPTSTKPHRMLTIDARGSTYTSVGGSRAEPPVFSKLASHQATFVAARDSMPRRSAKQTSRPP
jgi:hypothetical protein